MKTIRIWQQGTLRQIRNGQYKLYDHTNQLRYTFDAVDEAAAVEEAISFLKGERGK